MSQDMILVPISVGELIDKITILQIKRQKISDPQKTTNIETELAHLSDVKDALDLPDAVDGLETDLMQVNEKLWIVEDDLRDLEGKSEFGDRFVELARSVYKLNDHRAALKYKINTLTGSLLVEEKSYAGT